MAKSELVNNSLIPFILIAGVLSGSLLRTSPPADAGKAADTNTTNEKLDGVATPVQSWVSDLRPVMDTMDAALGAGGATAEASSLIDAAGITLEAKGEARDKRVLEAMTSLRAGLNGLADPTGPVTCGGASDLQGPANVIAAWILTDDGGDAKRRAAAAKGLLDEYRDWRLLADLANRVSRSATAAGPPHYTVDFMVATLPDYVDSNSGWLADQVMAAVQSGMAQEDYLFDRVKLVDWSRASNGPVSILSSSRLHERQPGAIVFRKVTGQTISIQVVMLVLETPTAGVHQIALRNSLWFLRTWNECTNNGKAPLRILGPSFSGSTVSLASVIGEAPFRTSFTDRIVITGSATANENAQNMATFSDGAIFRATVQTTAVLKARMAEYLTSLSSKWEYGEHVALLNESNTAYGGDANTATTCSKPASPPSEALTTPPAKGQPDSITNGLPKLPAFRCAKVFNFPLHVAQLRSDAPALGQPGGALLTSPAIPLNMREATPPSDLIPALRPQLTSPVVESTVDSILDAIRHEKISAVGIFATDDRDVLFLAREVKRASPDVQLFLFGTHGLYLHPDYLPYLRGALVASSYALTLANQPEIKDAYDALHRQPFPSMSAEGIFYATRALVSVHANEESETDEPPMPLMPYCGGTVEAHCVPVAPVSINVIGEDGYWTLPNISKANKVKAPASPPSRGTKEPSTVPVPAPPELTVAALPGLPL